MSSSGNSRKPGSEEKEFVSVDLGGVVKATVRDGRIIRVRPLIFGPQDEGSKSWSIQVGDEKFAPPRRSTPSNFTLASRRRVYAESRLLYPMKREDFDPNSTDRKTDRRGKSGYVRISWDEALATVTSEIRRIRSKYGPAAITATTSSHQMWGLMNYRFSAFVRFFNMLGYTEVFHNADSWEGWNWGAVHAYGFYGRLGIPDQYDLLEDAMKNSEMIVFWSSDPEATLCTYGGQESAIFRQWLKKLAKKMVVIDPFCNFTGSLYADKWLAPRPGTDSALALGIAHTWIREGTYDKEYVKTHTLGFEAWVDYVTGKDDGIEKTPEWAADLTSVPARTIRALAREWAAKRTMLAPGNRGGQGGACRTAYAHEWARMMVFLAAMQGYGKPGVNLWSTNTGVPVNCDFKFPGYTSGGVNSPAVAKKVQVNAVKQRMLRLLLPEAFLTSGPLNWRGEGFNGRSIEQQFKQYTYPLPAPEGALVKMFYRSGASYLGTMPDGNRWVRMYRSPKMEFAVCQTPWFEGEAKFADILLPACTNYERDDISEFYNVGGYTPDSYVGVCHRVFVYQQKCIEPLGESKSDYEIYAMLSDKLGLGNEYTEGNTVDVWLRKMYESSDMKNVMGWEQFKNRGYYVLPFPDKYTGHRAVGSFYETGTGLKTPSGKIEFYAQSLAGFDKEDHERPPVPHYIQSWEGHLSEAAKKYPLQLITPHPKFSFFTQHDVKIPWISEIPNHRVLKDGRYWWPVRLNTRDAKQRGIKEKDIVKVFNDRAAVLCIARVTERVKPGVVHSYEGSASFDPLDPDASSIVDRGGCVNLLTPSRMMSKNASGFAPNSCLVEIAKWEGGRR